MSQARFAEAAQYARAIADALDRGPEKHRELLQAHVAAPRQTRTYTQLAHEVGYANYGAVNLQYGILAHRVAENLGIFALPPEDFWGIVLVEWTDAYDPSGSRFRLRREVVEALELLGMVRATATQSFKALQPTIRARPKPKSRRRSRAARG